MEKTTQDVVASPHKKDSVKEETGHPPAPDAF